MKYRNLHICWVNKIQIDIVRDIEIISQQFNDRTFLMELNMIDWVFKRNSAIINFIQGVANLSLENAPEDVIFSICRIVEQIYCLKQQRLVAPISFLLSLNIYTKTSRKAAVDLLSKTAPSGCYKTFQRWITKTGSEEPSCPAETVMVGFDNEQVISYKRGISPNLKSKSSIITTHLYARMNTQYLNLIQQDRF